MLLLTGIPAPAFAQLLVAAASDLAPLDAPLTAAFQMASGRRLRFVFHSSGMLARQIQNGAPYDVYLSANEEYVRQLEESGDLLADTVRVYALGRLGLWSGRGRLGGLEALRHPEVRHIAIANPAHAPYGVAAKRLLIDRGLWNAVEPRIVLAENVRQAFQYAESGNADAVITSWTLVHDKGGVLLPADWHPPIRQAGGVLRRSASRAAAGEFLALLLSPAGRRILSEHGLTPPGP